MPRSRRFAVVAVLALLGALALTGCGKAQPDVAAYVGDTRYTERQLDAIVDELRAENLSNEERSTARNWALAHLILIDLGRRVAKAHGLEIPDAKYAESARKLGLPPGGKLVHLDADFVAIRDVLATTVEPVMPGEDDYREMWAALGSEGTHEELVRVLRSNPILASWLGVWKALNDQAAKTEVVVNPVHSPLVANAGERFPLLLIRFGEDTGLVADADSG